MPEILSVVFNRFTPVFRYKVVNKKICNEQILDESLWNMSGAVYFRAYRKSIVYIGKTNGPLKSRIRDHLRRFAKYEKPKDIEYRDWAENKIIKIYAYHPNEVTHLGLKVPIHNGLEHALIDAIKPRFVSRK